MISDLAAAVPAAPCQQKHCDGLEEWSRAAMLPRNITRVLAARETGQGARVGPSHPGTSDIKRRLEQWQEDDFVHHPSAKYGSFQPSPRSTIALSYNCSGTLLASTQYVFRRPCRAMWAAACGHEDWWRCVLKLCVERGCGASLRGLGVGVWLGLGVGEAE